ncbi:hypothetical protein O3P69_005079 [Scylla paramamosain]|uniref:Uncharacterized protein n=1 Tax=Scylla paramamosain TaxID=85552 RepID=A0AAW0U9W3_SCYPA
MVENRLSVACLDLFVGQCQETGRRKPDERTSSSLSSPKTTRLTTLIPALPSRADRYRTQGLEYASIDLGRASLSIRETKAKLGQVVLKLVSRRNTIIIASMSVTL